MSAEFRDAAVLGDFEARFRRWRQRYAITGQPTWDEPEWHDGGLWVRYGYPNPGWTAYVIAPSEGGFALLRVVTERRSDPLEVLVGYFTDADDAGKYIVFDIGESLRLAYGLAPLTPSWRAAGLDPRVSAISLEQYLTRYELVDNPARSMTLRVGGIQPQNRLLPLTYGELDTMLCEGMPTPG